MLGEGAPVAFETRLTPAMAARWRGAGLWGDETLASVLARRVRETPEREALTDGTHRLSYRELADGIDRMARGFARSASAKATWSPSSCRTGSSSRSCSSPSSGSAPSR